MVLFVLLLESERAAPFVAPVIPRAFKKKQLLTLGHALPRELRLWTGGPTPSRGTQRGVETEGDRPELDAPWSRRLWSAESLRAAERTQH